MLPIYVISLPNAMERRRNASAQLHTQSVDFEFFDAFDGERGAELFDRCDEQAFVLHTGRATTAGEIGCFASHKALWQRCIESNKNIMIMEDDFTLAANFAKAVVVSEALISQLGLLRLQDERRGRSKPIMQVAGFQLERYTKTPHCTMCYSITPRIAERLLNIHKVYCAPVDVAMKQVWTFGNPMYCLTPYTVSGSDLFLESMIGNRDKCRKRLLIRLRRTWLKFRWQWRRLQFNLRQDDEALRRRGAPHGRQAPRQTQASTRTATTVASNHGNSS
ncbi:MAG: glycosyltransferase family 25 protein [Woeseia sp.]